jgi:hypothetical protein
MVEYEYLTQTGVILPDTADLRNAVEAEFREAFGNDLDTSPETPQGLLITGETLARDRVVRNNADLANQINPNIAGGVFLDAIWALTGGQRVAATPSIVRGVLLTGVPGTIVPAGSLASVGVEGAQFALLSSVVLTGGSGVGIFQSIVLGSVAAPIGALNQIVTGVLGWETVSNPSAAEVGRDEESDIASRIRRRQTLALQGVTLPEAIMSGLRTVEGVRSAVFRENVTNADIVIEGVTLVPHSVYVDVDGGTDEDVAFMLLRKKSIGAAWNGNTTVTITEPFSGQPYDVKFSRPALVPIFVRVTVRGGASFPDVPGLVRQAMVDYANGVQEGEEGFIVGGDVSPFELASAVNRVTPTIYVQDVQLSTDGTTFSAANVTITIAQMATLLAGNIAVTVAP